jgi:hypothetical protein
MWFGAGGNCGCTGVLPPAAVTFNWTMFTTWFPEFSCLNQTQGQAYFDMAGLYCANSQQNPLFCFGILPQVMMLVTAHVAWLLAPRDENGNPAAQGAPGSPIVGRINTATQGSVSVGATLDGEAGSPSEQFFSQTKYGLMAWQAMAVGRTARYIANPTVVAGAVFPAAPWLPINFWGPVQFAGGIA